ncbi:carboxyl-terminal processing protease [Thermosyntropha lipolytica DSM 11003]|uniref:Carboxyl-terminal processing protease n=1 Tax=Thermosyntropha lipolytica DSM 11003 TaxID=1123382 RepID=A0A1M5KLG7_9FIRM|nr:S41 family peptidase [Thermosyntropha lipolytica]SHG53674.1 carboxyl-terminal processing protease [Thermosyntropha lipolytica DSM 11003]
MLRGILIFFALLGFLTSSALIFFLVTNAGNIGTLISVVTLIKTQGLYEPTPAQMISGAASGIVDSLNDPYSKYLDKDTWQELKIRLEAKFGGIGVYVLEEGKGRFKIISPIKGTPAYRAGIKNGDIILKINGESVQNMTQDEVVSLMRGDPGTQLLLTVYRESDGKEHEFKIIREIINVPSVEYEVLDTVHGIGYIALNQFHAGSAQEMAEAINDLAGERKCRGIILDLRYNGGGDFNAALEIASLFLDKGREIVRVKDGKGREEVYKSSGGNIDVPVVVLINEDTASAAEILAGALKDNQRAVLVGRTTFGKGLVQTVYPLRDGGALKLTTQKYFTPSGTDINEVGIHPDYEVEKGEKDKDKELDKALEIIKKQII